MASTATETEVESVLGEFEGTPVVGVRLVVRNTGDGLSDAMEVRPVVLRIGDEVGVFIRGKIIDVQHPVDKKNDAGVDRVHIVRAQKAVLVDGNLESRLMGMIARQDKEVQRKREADLGILGLPGVQDAADAVNGDEPVDEPGGDDED